MEVTEGLCKKIVITGETEFDSITLYIDDIRPGVGKLTITCWVNAWTSCWSEMGDQNVVQFFLSTSEDYLARCLSNVKPTNLKRQKLELSSHSYLLRIIRAVKEGLAKLEKSKQVKSILDIETWPEEQRALTLACLNGPARDILNDVVARRKKGELTLDQAREELASRWREVM